jgi:hypothetical protein
MQMYFAPKAYEYAVELAALQSIEAALERQGCGSSSSRMATNVP